MAMRYTVSGLSSNQCVFVGDQPYDITAGREAGLITVGAVWGSGDMETVLKTL